MKKNTEDYFSFIEDDNTKNLLTRDLQETHECIRKGLNKASLVMIGSLIECTLYFHISSKDELKSQIPGFDKRDIKLFDLLKWARDFKIIDETLYKLADPIREYRNMIHPRVQERLQIELSDQLVQIGYNTFLEITRRLNKHHNHLKNTEVKSIIIRKIKDIHGRNATDADFQVYIPILDKYGSHKGALLIEKSLISSKMGTK